MIDGVTISQAIRFVDTLYKDISRLIETMDSQMKAMEYKPLWGSLCYFKISQAVYNPIAWLPHVFARVYVPEGKEDQTFSTFAFFYIYLTPKHHDEPLAHWGVGERTPGREMWSVWDKELLRPTGPDFLRRKEVEPFQTTLEFAEILERFRYAVKPLVDLHSEDQLESLVLGPIRKELASLSEPSKERPKPKSR